MTMNYLIPKMGCVIEVVERAHFSDIRFRNIHIEGELITIGSLSNLGYFVRGGRGRRAGNGLNANRTRGTAAVSPSRWLLDIPRERTRFRPLAVQGTFTCRMPRVGQSFS